MDEGKLEARRPVGWPFQWSRQEIMRIWLKVVVGVKEMNLRHSEDNFSGKRHFLFWATFFYAFSVKESLNWKQTEMLGRCWGNHGLWCQTATAAAKSLQSCPTLCDRIDGSPPGTCLALLKTIEILKSKERLRSVKDQRKLRRHEIKCNVGLWTESWTEKGRQWKNWWNPNAIWSLGNSYLSMLLSVLWQMDHSNVRR